MLFKCIEMQSGRVATKPFLLPGAIFLPNVMITLFLSFLRFSETRRSSTMLHVFTEVHKRR